MPPTPPPYNADTCRSIRMTTRVFACRRMSWFSIPAMLLLGFPVIKAQNVLHTAGDWHAAGNWSGGIPVDGQDVIISANVTLTNSTARLASYTLDGGRTQTFRGTNTALRATIVTINGTMTHDRNSATAAPWTADHRIWIVGSNMTVNGVIDANRKGYMTGAGPGRGIHVSGGWYSGGSYGGGGGGGGDGLIYGSADAPSQPGSGGGINSPADTRLQEGGGWITLQADGLVTVNGTIRAHGGQSGTGGDGSGAGSGGAIFITCRATAGDGTIVANGGLTRNNRNQGGGGGGRVAIVYDSVAQAEQNLIAKPGLTLAANQGHASTLFPGNPGRPGTVYLTDTSFYPTPVLEGGAQIVIPGFTSWSLDQLDIRNGSIVLPDQFELYVTNNIVFRGYGGLWANNGSIRIGGGILRSNVTVSGSHSRFLDGGLARFEVGKDVQLDYGIMDFYSVSTNILTATVGGHLLMTNNSRLYLHAGITNATVGGTGLHLQVTSRMIVSGNSWVYADSHSSNGGAPLIECRRFELSANSGIDANARGYTSNHGPGSGVGYGGGWYGGGGHGGRGGGGAAGGKIYDWPDAPIMPGGGPGRPAGTIRGGGVIWLRVTDRMTLNGTLRANGGAVESAGSGDGGPAGGAIYLTCHTLAGTPVSITANGTGHPHTSGASGGGGRIAIWRVFDHTDTSAWTVRADGGAHATRPGENGTIVWGRIPPRGTLMILR